MPGAVAELCKERGAFLVHISTDFVFDGSSTQPYRETDEPKPVSAYGAGKLLGEDMIQDSGLENWLICRTAWLFGRPGNCFPKTMVNAAKAGKPLSVVGDQFGSPTLTDDLTQAIFALLKQGSRGLFHVTNSGQTNWADFTRAILKQFDIQHPVKSITSADWKAIKPASAVRPASSVLNCDKLIKATGLHMRPWEVALADYARQVSENGF
jgi:dTDP-4-dehydrorhamnose reductase